MKNQNSLVICEGHCKAFFRAYDYSTVRLDDIAHVILYNNTIACLEGKSSVRAYDSSSATLHNFATATVLNQSFIVAKDYSTVFAKNYSKVNLEGYSRALMYDDSKAIAQGNSVVYDNRDNSNNTLLENATQIKY